MSSRKSSSNRPRNWSSASFETNDDLVVFGGNTNSVNVIKPDRQPHGPPHRPDKAVGFAKFLKKHSSPNHNRVTAGGRIVPMEKRESPPRFNLSSLDMTQASNGIKQEFGDTSHISQLTFRPNGLHYYQDGTTSSSVQGELGNSVKTPATAVLNSDATATDQVPRMADDSNGNDERGTYTPRVNANLFQPQLNGAALFPMQTAYMPFPQTMPCTGYGWPLPDMYGMALLNASTATSPVNFQQTFLFTTQQNLVDAEALFDNLDRQLKLIDRHRAMNSHDPNLSAQRIAIVQQRAEIKDTIQRLKVQLEAEQSQAQARARMPFMPTAAPVFVPNAMTPIHQTVTSATSASQATVRASASADRPVVPTKGKAIPIVPPPPPSPTHAEPCKKAAVLNIAKPAILAASNTSGGSSQEEVVLISQDSDLAAGLSSNTSTDTQMNAEAFLPKPNAQLTAGGSGPHQYTANKQGKISRREWMESQGSEATAEVQSAYELQLDAMRLPYGVSVDIPTANGSLLHVPGCKLGQPSSSLMSETEREYWTRKPIFTSEMLQNLKAKARLRDLGLLTDEYLIASANGLSAGPKEKPSSNQNKSVERVQQYVEEQSTHVKDYAPLSHVSTKSEVSVAFEAAASATSTVLATSKQQPNDDVRGEDSSTVFDEMSHKGYSSIAVQTINVHVQLPPPGYDGATDGARKGAAAASLSTAGKSRSPRLLHRSTPNGGA